MNADKKLDTLLSEFSLLRKDITEQDVNNKNKIESLTTRVCELEDALEKLYKFNVERTRKHGSK